MNSNPKIIYKNITYQRKIKRDGENQREEKGKDEKGKRKIEIEGRGRPRDIQ